MRRTGQGGMGSRRRLGDSVSRQRGRCDLTWKTPVGTTQTMTKEAVLASQAAICVAQFMKQPNHEGKLKELGEVDSWKRAEVIGKGGWDKMPGQTKAGYAVARACADGLELLLKK